MNSVITTIATYWGLLIVAFILQLIANIIIIFSINRKVTILQRIAEEDFKIKYPREYKYLTNQDEEDTKNDDKLTKKEIILLLVVTIIFTLLIIMINAYN